MDVTEFKEYADKMSNMLHQIQDHQHLSIYVADYLRGISTLYGVGKVIYDLVDTSIQVLQGLSLDECDFAHLSEMSYFLRSKDAKKGTTYKTQAYFFVLCVFAVAMGKMKLEEVDTDDFDSDEFQEFSAATLDIDTEMDPIEKKLEFYRLRLLDFSRSNPLVHFKRNRTSALQFYTDQIGNIMRDLAKKKKVKISKWNDYHFNIIYRCKICGRYHFKHYDSFNPNSKLSMECPICDENNTHHRKSMVPLDEDLQFGIDEYTCSSCGKKIPIVDIQNGMYQCPDCNTKIQLTSFPYVSLNEVSKPNEHLLLCNLSDKNLYRIITIMQGRAQNMEKNFGLHVLYLACGFLQWTDINGTNYTSPILLCPIHFKNDKNSYYIELDESGEHVFEVNRTLEHMLEGYAKYCSIHLPTFDDEGDVFGAYFTILESYFKNDPTVNQFTKNWKVDRSLGVGLFHYQKLQLETDLSKNKPYYLNHPMIRRICGDEEQEIPLHTSQNQNPFQYLLFDADSSQENVIQKAMDGKSYILEGPPGSGKSQTISNIIALSIGSGKSVLFVTEKATARTIIYENLKEKKLDSTHSLTDYILDFNQFHLRGGAIPRSNFIEEINRVIKLDNIPQSNIFFDQESKNTLHQYIETYQKEFCTMDDSRNSLMGILNQMAQYVSYSMYHEFSKVNSDIYTLLSYLRKYYAFFEKKSIAFDYRTDELYHCIGDDDHEIVDYANLYIEMIQHGDMLLHKVSSTFHLSLKENDRKEYQYLFQLFSKYQSLCPMSNNLLEEVIKEEDTSKLLNYFEERKVEMEEFLPYYDYQEQVHEDLLSAISFEQLNERANEYHSVFKRLKKGYRTLKNEIKSYFKQPIVLKTYDDVMKYVKILNQYYFYREKKKVYDSRNSIDQSYLGYVPKEEAMWDKEIQAIQIIPPIHQVMNDYETCSLSQAAEFLKNFSSNLFDRNIQLAKQFVNEFQDIIDQESFYLQKLNHYFDDELNEICPKIVLRLEKILKNQDRLLEWTHFMEDLKWFYDHRAESLLHEIIEQQDRNYLLVEKRIYRSYYEQMLKDFIEKNHLDHIASFQLDEHISYLNHYANMDLHDLEHAKSYLYDRLFCLRKEAAKNSSSRSQLLSNKAGYSIKKTISENWEYIKSIKPCFMMSPLNVSQYIDIDHPFDLVIFDEASQIFTEDALASIVRGKQIIIVGDSKQLPPCDFFRAQDMYQDDQDDLFEDDQNQENSILNDTTKALGDISIQLNWHYRSYDESLIAFSNEHFNYHLITFPAAIKDVNDGIEYISVPYDENLCYSSGKNGTHTNQKEASKVVETLWREINHPERSKYSLGVVAFSNAQADAIREEWNDFRKDTAKDAIIKAWEATHEEIIFCNLDTMQGDERDTMLISICYSLDKNDKFLLTYLGRIRLSSGKKRLNVAITRARHRMIVISMLENQRLKRAIEESLALEENKEGAKSLYEFLEYASSFKNENHIPTMPPSSEIVKSICEVLDQEQIVYDTEIGRSKCKINIGIRKMPFNGDYLLGIIVDDPGRSDFDSSREYARLTEEILRNKYHWDIYRIYPLSWIHQYEQEKDKLIRKIRSIIGH